MAAPKLNGFPLWKGRIKKKVAKRFIAREICLAGADLWWKGSDSAASFKAGDLASDCDGYNHYISSVRAEYVHYKRGQILYEIVAHYRREGHEQRFCHIESPYTKEQIQKEFEGWRDQGGGWGFWERHAAGVLHEDGTFTDGKV